MNKAFKIEVGLKSGKVCVSTKLPNDNDEYGKFKQVITEENFDNVWFNLPDGSVVAFAAESIEYIKLTAYKKTLGIWSIA